MKVRCILLQAGLPGVLLLALASSAQPVITIQPTNQTVVAGSTVVFSVTATDIGPLTYQWQSNGTNLPNNIITTMAGNGSANYSGDGGAATNASLNQPQGVAFDAAGNLFIADNNNDRVRKVDANGIISTVAGNGAGASNGFGSYSGDGGAATNAGLYRPNNLAFDSRGSMFIADIFNSRVRKVDTNGIISTVANLVQYSPTCLAFDAAGNLFISILGSLPGVEKLDTNGIITSVSGTIGFGFNCQGVALDAAGNLYVAGTSIGRIGKVSTNGVRTILAGGGQGGDGGAATNAALGKPWSVVLDGLGNMYIADLLENRIRKVDTYGIITTVVGNGIATYAGDGGAATNASLNNPACVALDSAGNLYIADGYNNRIREVHFEGIPTLSLSNETCAGNYSVIVTGADGSVTSSVVTLTVILPPQNFTASLGIAGLQLQFNGTTNYLYILQTATNLAPPVLWQSVLTNPADVSGNWSFTVTNTQDVPVCFYRISTP